MISDADTDCDRDSDPDNSWRLTAKSRITYSSPERQSLSGSHMLPLMVYPVPHLRRSHLCSNQTTASRPWLTTTGPSALGISAHRDLRPEGPPLNGPGREAGIRRITKERAPKVRYIQSAELSSVTRTNTLP